MTRATAKQSADEKKESGKKRPVNKTVKKSDTTVWPCKINGCNKEFAREADLKRHQRTTKQHSSPTQQPVACPQCQATFTRTDALRRHQKSRHNGVILEPLISIPSRRQDDGPEGSNASGSRSSTPTRGLGSSSNTTAPVPTMMTRPDPPGQIGPTSYYRQQSINPVFVPPRTPHGVLDPTNYQTAQLPTSATRFNGPVTYLPAPPTTYYAPGAYYRTPDGQPIGPMSVPLLHPPPPLPVGTVTMQVNPVPSAPPPPPVLNTRTDSNDSLPSSHSNTTLNNGNNDHPPPHATTETKQLQDTNHVPSDELPFSDPNITAAVQKALQAVLAIDPSLNGAVQEILPHAMLATQALKESEACKGIGTSTGHEHNVSGDVACQESRDREITTDTDGELIVDSHTTDESNDAMAMLTEDGVVMLRPDELLNEETLSYPSPP